MISKFLSALEHINLGAPYKSLVICGIITMTIILSVIIIGTIIDKIELLQIRLLTKAFNERTACLIANRFTFIGTIVHEYSHALFATMTGAKVTEIKCFDIGKGDQLGHCTFYTQGTKLQQMMQLTISACAPVIMGFIINAILITYVLPLNLDLGVRIFVWYCIISIADHMTMSPADIKNYCRGLVMLLPLLFAIIWVIRVLLSKA